MQKVVGVLLALAVGWQASPAWAEEEGRATTRDEAALPAEKPAPPRRMRDRNTGARLGLVIGGSVGLTLFYVLPCAGEGGLWCVPFAGPVLVVAKRERQDSASGAGGEDGIVPPAFVYTLAGGLGLLQVASAVVFTAGALLPRREVPATSASITLLPMLGSSTAGVAATGTW